MDEMRDLGLAMTAAVPLIFSSPALALELSTWGDAFRNGKPTVNLRYRFESVEQNNALRDADASTLRTRLGFATDDDLAVSAVVEVENVLAIGSERYNSTTNGRSDFSVVIDPEETEVNQAYLTLRVNKTNVSVGRRRMVLDNGRFLGNIDFRQNEQTYDAVVVMNTSLPGHRFIYTFMDEAHRFFGDDSPAGNLDMSSHFLNYSHTWLNDNKLVLYAYFLEMDPTPIQGRSTKTFGARFNGGVDIGAARLLYTLEYADQSPYAKGNDSNDADYLLVEAGARFANQWVGKIGSEWLAGDGTYGFQTQLATTHAFAGDADIFAAVTPPNGLVDRYVKLSVPIKNVNVKLAYHDFVSDNASLDYGTEWDATVSTGMGEHVTAGLQFASYDAEQFAVDTDKLWVWLSFRY